MVSGQGRNYWNYIRLCRIVTLNATRQQSLSIDENQKLNLVKSQADQAMSNDLFAITNTKMPSVRENIKTDTGRYSELKLVH